MNEEKRRSISPRVRFLVFQRDGFACTYCGRKAGGVLTLQIDHVRAFSKGGVDDVANYVTACNECNAGKSDRDVVSADEATPDATGIVGKFFHVLYPGEYRVCNQGVVEADYGFALRVRFFEWFLGGDSWYWRLVPKADVATDRWCWYDSADEMRDAYEYGNFKKEQGV